MSDKCDKHDSHQHHHHSPNHSVEQHPTNHGHHGHEPWSAEEYEQKVKAMDYNGPKLVVENFDEFNIPKNSKIIDLAAGTGLVGSVLRDKGYTNIDALDGSSEMLVMAKKRQCYENIITCFITRDKKLPIEDHTYDHIIMCGSLCHIDYESLPKIIRICKPGGIISWAIGLSEDLIRIEPKFSDGQFEKYIESLCEQNLWEFVSAFPKRVNNYAMGRDGWVYAMKVL